MCSRSVEPDSLLLCLLFSVWCYPSSLLEGDGRFADVDRARGLVSTVLVWKPHSEGLSSALGARGQGAGCGGADCESTEPFLLRVSRLCPESPGAYRKAACKKWPPGRIKEEDAFCSYRTPFPFWILMSSDVVTRGQRG